MRIITYDQIAKAVSGVWNALFDDRRRSMYIAEVTAVPPYYHGKERTVTELLFEWITGTRRRTARPKSHSEIFFDLHIHPSEITHDSEVSLTKLVNKGREIGLDLMGCVCHVDPVTPEYNSVYKLLTENPPEELLERYEVVDKGFPLVQLVDNETILTDFNNALIYMRKDLMDKYYNQNPLTINAEDFVADLPRQFVRKFGIKTFQDFQKFLVDRNSIHILDGYELKVEGPENAEVLVYGYNRAPAHNLPLEEALRQLPSNTLRIASHEEFIDSMSSVQAERLPLQESHIAAALSMWTAWGPAFAKFETVKAKRRYRSLLKRISERFNLGEKRQRYQDLMRRLASKLQRVNTVASSDAHHLYDLGAGNTVNRKYIDFDNGPECLASLKLALYKRKHKKVEYTPNTWTFLWEGGAYKLYTAFKNRLLSYIPV